ncbi:MAG: 16S rRNA (guanine(527)-N(7))-methyltransferase RsmG [Acidobacteriaceae bacterium]
MRETSWRTVVCLRGRLTLDSHRAQLDAAAAARFEAYLALLLKWNARLNLTAVRKPEAIVSRHFAECIFAAGQIPSHAKTLLDFGSGAGLPGIPIAILRPDLAVTLAESQSRKAAFLHEAIRTLELKAEVWAGRVEALPGGRVFDWITLRAVDRLPAACRIALSHLAPGGSLMVFATRKTEAVLNQLPGIQWDRAIPLSGSEQALLKVGQRA